MIKVDESLTQEHVNEILDDGVVQVADVFEHSLTNEPQGPGLEDLQAAEKLIQGVQIAMETWYKGKFNQDFDRYNLITERRETVLGFFRSQEGFNKALVKLGIHASQAADVSLPWWNEISLLESRYETDVTCKISSFIQPSHSYITQLKRKGKIESPMATMSVSGLLQTKENDEGVSHIVLGVRGGLSFPNTYHLIPIGGAKFDKNILSGPEPFENLLRTTELVEEFGAISRSTSITPLCRALDLALIRSPGDVNYCYSVKLDLTKGQVEKHWRDNNHEDAKEHGELLFIENDKDAILKFIKDNYRGITKNEVSRPRDEAELLHPAMLVLIAHAGISLAEIKALLLNN